MLFYIFLSQFVYCVTSESQRGSKQLRFELPTPDIGLEEYVYNNQKAFERTNANDPYSVIARYEAEWPCLWGMEVVGDVRGTNAVDGWKFTCGIPKIRNPCIVYSFGSNGNFAFEAGLLKKNRLCEIYVFDKDDYTDSISQWFPVHTDVESLSSRVKFQRAYIGSTEDKTSDPPKRNLAGIMRDLHHDHIDVLKVDIEGSEFDIFKKRAGDLPSVGQLLVEVHLSGRVKSDLAQYQELFDYVEGCGLRLFHKEVNAKFNVNCVELSFIQRHWHPAKKSYHCDKGAT